MAASTSKGVREGWRSGLEEKVAASLEARGVPVLYETETLRYETPATPHKYTPDFLLPNGIRIETKGRFVTADRKKHLLIKKQHPELDLRFVFTNPNAKLYKGSPTSYAAWCEKHGFLYAKRDVPAEWISE